MDETKTQLSKTKEGISNFAGGLTKAFGFAVAEIAILKKAFEFGKEQAMIEFTQKKFDRLSESIGTTSDALLGDLKRATGGLISDMELVTTATDFMTLGLVKTHDEAVRLTSIAGQLGMNMNQLVLTLTNQTTMRFDALGVAVDGFDEKVAALKATGMDTNAAFTEAFLQQAEEQIEKVGGIADSSAASFMRMEASVKNLTDELKRRFVPILGDAADGLYWLLNYTNEIDRAFQEHKDNVEKTSNSYDEYATEVIRAGNAAKLLTDGQTEALRLFIETGTVLPKNIDKVHKYMSEIGLLSEEQWNAAYSSEAQATNTHEAILALKDGKEAVEEYKDATMNASDAMRKYNEELLFSIASQGLSEEAALMLAYQMGLVDEKTVYATQKISEYQKMLDDGKISVETYTALVAGLADAIDRIPTEKTVTITGNFINNIPSWIMENSDITAGGGGSGSNESPESRPLGGGVLAGDLVKWGEYGRPEMFITPSSGQVVNAQQIVEAMRSSGVNMAGGGVTIENLNVYTNSGVNAIQYSIERARGYSL